MHARLFQIAMWLYALYDSCYCALSGLRVGAIGVISRGCYFKVGILDTTTSEYTTLYDYSRWFAVPALMFERRNLVPRCRRQGQRCCISHTEASRFIVIASCVEAGAIRTTVLSSPGGDDQGRDRCEFAYCFVEQAQCVRNRRVLRTVDMTNEMRDVALCAHAEIAAGDVVRTLSEFHGTTPVRMTSESTLVVADMSRCEEVRYKANDKLTFYK
jgi:hypothetical protein